MSTSEATQERRDASFPSGRSAGWLRDAVIGLWLGGAVSGHARRRNGQKMASDALVMSVISICPGAWAMASGSFAAINAVCGVTPHAQ
ncbi:hypothetical protein OKW49_002281 [Paraburkholderia youngii]